MYEIIVEVHEPVVQKNGNVLLKYGKHTIKCNTKREATQAVNKYKAISYDWPHSTSLYIKDGKIILECDCWHPIKRYNNGNILLKREDLKKEYKRIQPAINALNEYRSCWNYRKPFIKINKVK